jgi:hypothetical protein
VHAWTKITSNPIRDIRDDAKLAVVVLVQTLSAFPTYECLDTEFLLQFPCKAIFESFSVLDLTSWKLPEPSELFPA